MGIREDIAKSAIRISFSHHTTQDELDEFLFYLKKTLKTIKKQR